MNLLKLENAINRCKKRDFKNETKNLTQQLNDLERSISEIKNCSLKNYATKMVFSDGNPNSKIMIVGEGPGANEDKEGLPFVGRAGQLLDKMLKRQERAVINHANMNIMLYSHQYEYNYNHYNDYKFYRHYNAYKICKHYYYNGL